MAPEGEIPAEISVTYDEGSLVLDETVVQDNGVEAHNSDTIHVQQRLADGTLEVTNLHIDRFNHPDEVLSAAAETLGEVTHAEKAALILTNAGENEIPLPDAKGEVSRVLRPNEVIKFPVDLNGGKPKPFKREAA